MSDAHVAAYRLLMADVFELAGASRRSSEAIAAEVSQTAARWHVMSAVSEAPANVPAIARRLGLTRQSVQRVVNDLVDAGGVVLVDNPGHQRSPLVAVTEQGSEQLTALFERAAASRGHLVERAGVSAKELARAGRVIRALASAFDS